MRCTAPRLPAEPATDLPPGRVHRTSAVTIRDVAREAGVSVATVSRALNDLERVTDVTRARVRKVAERLGYAPHGGARSLITRRTGTLGVLLPDLYGEFFSEVIRGIDQTAQKHGFHMLVASSHSDAREIAAAVGNMRGRVDGFVVMSPDTAARAALAGLARSFPTVIVGGGSDIGPFTTLSVNNYDGAAAMMHHLLGLGHRRIAFVRGPAGNVEANDRLRAVREVAASYPDCTLQELAGDFRQESGFDAVRPLLHDTHDRPGERPDAIFAANDAMAIGVLGALHEAGVRVPDDVAVVGFDDTPIARFLLPPLTTVRVPIAELGEQAALRLIDALRGGPALIEYHAVLPTSLIIRASCGASRRVPSRRSVP